MNTETFLFCWLVTARANEQNDDELLPCGIAAELLEEEAADDVDWVAPAVPVDDSAEEPAAEDPAAEETDGLDAAADFPLPPPHATSTKPANPMLPTSAVTAVQRRGAVGAGKSK